MYRDMNYQGQIFSSLTVISHGQLDILQACAAVHLPELTGVEGCLAHIPVLTYTTRGAPLALFGFFPVVPV